MKRLLATTVALAGLAAASAPQVKAQTALVNLGADYTASFVGDDFDGLDGGIGVQGGLLFPLGPMSHIGGEVNWTGIDFTSDLADDAADASILDIVGDVNIGLSDGTSARPYIDLRAGYSRMAFQVGDVDGSVDGPTAGGGLGVRLHAGGIMVDLHGRYQHHWYGDFNDDNLIFSEKTTGGRLVFGAGISIPMGGGGM
jgi:hypothetical protein